MLASSEKIEVASSYVVMPLSDASGVVVDRGTSAAFIQKAGKAGVEVFVAGR